MSMLAARGVIFLTLTVLLVQSRGYLAASAGGPRSETLLMTTTRFSGEVKVPHHGTTISFQVELKEWQLDSNEQSLKLPIKGFYIAHALVGAVHTQIAGKSETHLAGDFWTVESGTPMLVSIKTPQQAAILETLGVTPAR